MQPSGIWSGGLDCDQLALRRFVGDGGARFDIAFARRVSDRAKFAASRNVAAIKTLSIGSFHSRDFPQLDPPPCTVLARRVFFVLPSIERGSVDQRNSHERARKVQSRLVYEKRSDRDAQVSPLARAMIGKAVGDVIRAGRDDAEITSIAR